MKKLLVIEDSVTLCSFLKRTFGDTMEVLTANSGKEGMDLFEREAPDVVLLDVVLPDSNGLELLDRIKEMNANAHVVVMTGFSSMETTIRATKAGAFSYISKPFRAEEISIPVKGAIESAELCAAAEELFTDDEALSLCRESIIGTSRAAHGIFTSIATASQSAVSVLLQGETGTGKELIARAVHYNSPNKDEPFVAINCSAIVETLLESEFFGHEKGAFTGAYADKAGKFEVARGGTVFLDEVGDMSLAVQSKLLRVLQEKSFERVGGTETIKCGARVVAATNRDLEQMVKEGLFREDLYYRLSVIPVAVPPLRERRDDIPLLVKHFLQKANADLHKKVKKVPDPVMKSLIHYSWPGNVRELENVITRAVLVARDDVLTDLWLRCDLENTVGGDTAPAAPPWRPVPLDEVEKVHIKRVLDHMGWNKSKSLAILGISMPTLLRKIKKYGLSNDGGQISLPN